MVFSKLSLEGTYLIEPEPINDRRGIFTRIFCKRELEAIAHNKEIVQINHSINIKKGAIRGLHFQKKPKSEIKFVKCLSGAIFDVVVDIRKSSPTLLHWHSEVLSAENMRMLYIPEGFAHGFQTLDANSEILYLHTEFYSQEHEGALRYDDPIINIDWPLEITEISERDKSHPFLSKTFNGFEF